MSSETMPAEPTRGYLSEDSKRRFTIVAGILGAVFFLAQFILPFVVVLAIMLPMMLGQEFETAELDQSALWKGDLWLVSRTMKPNWRDIEDSTTTLALSRVRLDDLATAGPRLPLGDAGRGSTPALLPVGDRLWLIGASTVGFYEGASFTRLNGAGRPRHASRPFAHEGRPAVISFGRSSRILTLKAEGDHTEWTGRDLSLDLPADRGSLRALQAVEAAGHLYLFAQLCTDEPDQCSLDYRELESGGWLPLLDDVCSCGGWTALDLGSRPAVVLSERQGRSAVATRIRVVTLTAEGPRQQGLAPGKSRMAWSQWRPFSRGNRLVVVSQGMPGSLELSEFVDGRVVRTVKRAGSFPFGPNLLLVMTLPQLLPALLSLTLALLLTIQMRRHRVPDYVLQGDRRRFATLWQRALAQLVDIVPLGAGFLLPMAWMWRSVSDPESLAESGPLFPVWLFGLSIAAFLFSLLVLVAYSYLEGRFGKTPGKWLLGIRVLGTDLRPCGFGRALVRNFLTFVDGFFNFLVGALLVALTENWQRLGDLAGRTIVVSDQKPA